MAQYEKRGYLLENFRLFHLRSEQGETVDYHYHEFCKLLLLVSGKGNYVVDGQRYRLQAGDAVLVGSRSVHRPELESGTVYERIIIYIAPEFLEKASTEDCDLAEIFDDRRGPILRMKESRRRRVFAMAAELEEELSADAYGREILSSSALLRLLVELGRSLQQTDSQKPEPVMPKNPRVLEMMRYIEEHLAEDLDIDDLAEYFYISKYHMMRLFHREVGTTIHAYLSQRRLLHARELIGKGMRATEACYRSGFRSYSSFTRAYSKYFGTTPTGRVDAAHEREGSYE